MALILALISFVVIAVASRQFGLFLTRARLPLISGYLLTGMLVGTFGLNLISAADSANLRFLDDISLAFIAFAAGSELYLQELRSRFRSIVWHTIGQVTVIFVVVSAGVYLLSDAIPFMQGVPPTHRLAIALLAGAIMVARSPSSVIAIVNELRAKGPFTKTILGVTVVLDVGVVILFAVCTAIADILVTSTGFDPGFILLLIIDLAASVIVGYIAGKVLQLILSAYLTEWMKYALILVTGYGIFMISRLAREYTHDNLPFEILLEPLLICMIASFTVTNFSRYRDEFLHFVETIGPPVYVVFFTLVGISLRVDILIATFLITLVIFTLRLAGMVGGALLGGRLAGDPPQHNRLAWMGYVTQAGVTLGLVRETGLEFPEFGDEFATMIISVVVLSQFIGPPLLKYALKRVGEAHLPGQPQPDQARDVLILGIEDQSRALARQLTREGWKVTIADIDRTHLRTDAVNGIEERFISDISAESLSSLVTKATDAIVTLMRDDAANLKAIELAYEEFGIPRRIVRLNDLSWADRFAALNALVVYPSSAIVHLLDHFVRAPYVTSLLIDNDPDHEVIQVTVDDPDIHGLPLRDLRLPSDVLVLGIMRDGHSIMPYGATQLRLKDEVTLIGNPASLENVALRLGY